MKILLAPSETKTLTPEGIFDASNLLFCDTLTYRENLVKCYNTILSTDNQKQIQEMFGLKKQKDINFYKNKITSNSPACKAIKLYSGVAYDYLDYHSLDTKAQQYLHDHLLIFSNLFGVIRANDNLPLYRAQQGKNIGGFVPEIEYKKVLQPLLDAYLQNDDILDIRAGYYDKFYLPNKRYTTLKFLKNGKVVSHWAKAYRGKVLREIAKNNINNLQDFMTLNIDGLQIVEIQEKKNKTEIIYAID